MTKRDEQLDFIDQPGSSLAPKLTIWLAVGFVASMVIWEGIAGMFSGFNWGLLEWALPDVIADALPSGSGRGPSAAAPGCIILEDGTQICDEAMIKNAGE